MPRAVDAQLLVVALLCGMAMSALAWARDRDGGIGPGLLAAAVAAAVTGDALLVGTLPRGAPGSAGQRSLVLAAVLLSALGGSRVRATVDRASIVPVLGSISVLGVWAGVPETSPAVLVAGVMIGIGVGAALGGSHLSTWGAAVGATLPVAAAAVGAQGNAHALAGGVLCSATMVVLAVGPRVDRSGRRAAVAALGVHTSAVVIAARHVAVARSWEGAPARVALVIALSALAAIILWRNQRRLTIA